MIVFINVNCEFCSKLLHLSDTFYNYAVLCLSMIITVQVLCMQLLVQTSFDSVQLRNSRCDILSNYSACSVNVIYYMFYSTSIVCVVIRAGEVNGVALWCQFDFGDGQTVSTGPQEPPQVGQPVKWDRCCRQGVYLTPSPLAVTPGHALRFTSLFTPAEGTLTFNWTF